MIGLPFFVLSTASPTTQRWFAALPGGREPYRLFAASNAGSLIGLVAYPTLVEPNLDLTDQARWWVDRVRRVRGRDRRGGGRRPSLARAGRRGWAGAPDIVSAAGRPRAASPEPRWVLLAAVPAALLIGVTTHITTDVAAVPFLWIVPLTVYLATLILAFLRAAPIGMGLGTRGGRARGLCSSPSSRWGSSSCRSAPRSGSTWWPSRRSASRCTAASPRLGRHRPG